MANVIEGLCYDCGEWKDTHELNQIPNGGHPELMCDTCLDECEHPSTTDSPQGNKRCTHCGTILEKTRGQSELGEWA